ncbi:MAG: TPM domain-containing protein, partial [Candidatus Woesearchaeota archaeon]|nr:TPM domain-containing protein [Candidatus Woesearchaeota archaeon]
MKKIWARIFLFALLLAGAAQAEVAIPPLTQRVTDLTATLDAQQTQTLEARLAAFEAKKGVQLAVLIVPSTQPESIEQFGMRVAEAWKLGRKGVDDGALLLVAKNDRTLRIEVGYGLEGVLNDATA